MQPVSRSTVSRSTVLRLCLTLLAIALCAGYATAQSVSAVYLTPYVLAGATATGEVVLDSSAPSGGLIISLSSNNSSAVVPQGVTVAPGAQTAVFPITTSSVAAVTDVAVTATTGSTSGTGQLSITPSVVATSFDPRVSILRGSGQHLCNLILDGPAPVGGLTVALSVLTQAPGYIVAVTVPASVTVPEGMSHIQFPVTVSGPVSGRVVNAIKVQAGPNVAPTAPMNYLFVDFDGLSGLSLAPSSVSGGVSSTGTVTLTYTAETGGVSVALFSDNAAATVPASVTIPAGATSATFPVSTSAVSAATTANISAVFGGVTQTAALTVNPPTVSGVSLSPTSVNGGTSSTGTVTLNGPAPSGGLPVALSSDNAAASVPGSVTVPAGSSSATFTISTNTVSTLVVSNISAAYNGATQTAALTVNPIATAISITNVNNGDVLSGEMVVNVMLLPGTYQYGDITLAVDGTQADAAGDLSTTTASGVAVSMTLATDEYTNGIHTLTVSDGVNSASYNVTFSNDVSNISVDGIFDPSGSLTSDGVGTTAQFSGTASGAWEVDIVATDGSNATIRSFTGSNAISVIWDGTDNNGNPVPDDSYTVSFSTTAAASPHLGGGSGHKKPTSKQTLGDALLIFANDRTIFPGGYQTLVDYKNSVVQKLKPHLVPAGTINKISSLIIDPRTLKVPTPKNGNTNDPRVNFINHELSIPLRVFYVDTHGGEHQVMGGPQYPYFSIGAYGWYSAIDANSPLRARGTVATFDVSGLTASANYGGDFGNDPPGIVWIDSCNSAGGNSDGTSDSDPNTNGDSFQFANDFQSGNYFGVFLGWNGFTVNYGAYAPPNDDWTFWRLDMWTQLLNSSQNYTSAFNRVVTDYGYHGIHFPYTASPQYRARITGNGSDNFQ